MNKETFTVKRTQVGNTIAYEVEYTHPLEQLSNQYKDARKKDKPAIRRAYEQLARFFNGEQNNIWKQTI